MKCIRQTTDVGYILATEINGKSIYENLAYDDSPSLQDYEITGIWFILYEDNKTAGFINLKELNNILWSPHIFIFEEYRRNGSEEWGKLVAQYMVKYFGAKKFLALTPYESAKKYAEKMGFKYVATLTSSIKKDGILMDQYILELGAV